MDSITVDELRGLGLNPSIYLLTCGKCRNQIDVFVPIGMTIPLDSPGSVKTFNLGLAGLPPLCAECLIEAAPIDERAALATSIQSLRAVRGRMDVPDEVTTYVTVAVPIPSHPRLKNALVEFLAVRIDNMPDEWKVPFLRFDNSDPTFAPITLAYFAIIVHFQGEPGALELRWSFKAPMNSEPVVELVGLPPLLSLRSFKSTKRLIDGLEIVTALIGGRPTDSRTIPMESFPSRATEAFLAVRARQLKRPSQLDVAGELGMGKTAFGEQLRDARRQGMPWPPE